MSKTLQEEETPIDQEIVQELVTLTPEWWDLIELQVTDTSDNTVSKYSHLIKSLQGYKEYVEPSNVLYDATYRLAQLFENYGQKWKKATYRVEVEKNGNFQYQADFEY